ncbi:MAG: pirin family protein [Bacteroidota bacterium]|nr:pirin family protein [Bacteroidota bacterium]
MKKNKSVEAVLAPPAPHMVGDGFRVHNFFPSGYSMGNKRMSPFFLLDYNSKIEFSPSTHPRGVGVHPHRGFETVTISYHGNVAHHDSAGNQGVIGEGDVQWMTAGSGILHKEYHEKEFSEKGGPFQMVQLWVNLPARYKMSKPKYQALLHENMAKFELDDQSGTVNIIAGYYQGAKGSADTFSRMNVFDIRLNATGKILLSLEENFNTGILIIEGRLSFNGSEIVEQDHFVLFRNDGTEIDIEAKVNSIILVLSGEPIDEPIAQYGPFLMNTHAELEEALRDVNLGKFGHLED